MVTDYKQIYYDDTFNLAKTLVVKSSQTASLINQKLKYQYGASSVDDYDPTTWKYYLNLCGEYHPTDTLMTVTSLDTLKTIDFTKDNLKVHTATASAYAYGSRYYYNLVNQYPDQEQLILGILYPADLTTAIAAADGEILAYPTALIEPQEITLITELQVWIQNHLQRWGGTPYGISDTLYPATYMAIMYHQIFIKLFMLRQRRCKTNEAHSFHVRMYLASHKGLDKYFDYMTVEQRLFLYRNICYIERNGGQQQTFDWLVEKLLTLRGIPLAEFVARLSGTFDDQYYPEYYFYKNPLNTETNIPDQYNYTLTEILNKEEDLLDTNADYLLDQKTGIDDTFKNANKTVIPTKMLESSMLDLKDSVLFPLTEILFQHWMYMTAKGMYSAVANFKDAQTGDLRTIRVADAFLYYIYIACKGMGIKATVVPTLYCNRITRNPRATVADLMEVVDTSYIRSTDMAQYLVNTQPVLTPCYSISAFYDLCGRIYDATIRQWYLAGNTQHAYRRALVKNMINRLYCDTMLTFGDSGKNYSEWLTDKGIPDLNYTTEECMTQMTNIFQAATGYSINPDDSPANIQKAMVSSLLQLSSYSIQISRYINTTSIKLVECASMRVGDVDTTVGNEIYTENNSKVQTVTSDVKHEVYIDANPVGVGSEIIQKFKTDVAIPGGADVSLGITHVTGIFVDMGSMKVMAADNQTDPNDPNSWVLGYSSFSKLTEDQKRTIMDIYQPNLNALRSNTQPVTSSNDVVLYNTFDFNYLPIPDNEIDTFLINFYMNGLKFIPPLTLD